MGLSAAILLARLDVPSLLVERHPSTTDHPKARGFFARTMEVLRPWGIEASLRAGALPASAGRFIWVESLSGREIGRVEPPRRAVPGPYSPTYACIAAQDALEAEFRRHAEIYSHIDLRFSTELVAFEQDPDGVTVTLSDRRSGEVHTRRAAYLIAADGASSQVREALGIPMLGPGEMGHNINIHFRAELGPWVASDRPPGISLRAAMAPCCGRMEPTGGCSCVNSDPPTVSAGKTSHQSAAASWCAKPWVSPTCRST